MLITKETDYAIRILRALADGNKLTTAQIAISEQIPQQFAYKIIKKLQKGGIVSISRGINGGCVLATSLENISMQHLIQTMEGDTSVCSCMKPDYLCRWRKAHSNSICQAHLYLASVQEKLDRELASHSLKEILCGS